MTENKKLAKIMTLVSDDVSNMREHSRYVGDEPLTYLTEKQAEMAIFLGIPVGVKSLYDVYHGSHKGEYSYSIPSSIESLHKNLSERGSESRASICPFLPDPKRMLGYIQKIEEMNLSEQQIKIAGGYGAKQLSRVTNLIELSAGGKQELAVDSLQGVFIRTDNSANVGLSMRRHFDSESELYRLEFQGYVCKMGIYMSAAKTREFIDEVEQIATLLEELEREPIMVTQEEMQQWAQEIEGRQHEQATDLDHEPDHGPTMGMT